MNRKPVTWKSMDKKKISLNKLIVQFEVFNRSEGKTPKTIAWYRTGLGLFMDYLEYRNVTPTLGNIGTDLVREYIVYLQTRNRFADHPYTPDQGRPLSPISVQCYVRALKSFFNWLFKEGYTEEDELGQIKPPRTPKKLVDPLSREEITLIMASLDPGTLWGSRNVTIFLLLLDTGIRFSEALTLEMSRLHLEDNYLKVMGKGQKERIVPFGSSAQRVLMKYIYHFRPEPSRGNRVFLNLDGSPMTETGLKLMIRRLGKSSGVPRLHAHLLRHTFAVNYLMDGGDVFTLQQILGHTTLEMVRRYINLSGAQLMAQHQRHSPVDRMNIKQVTLALRLQKTRRRPTRKYSRR